MHLTLYQTSQRLYVVRHTVGAEGDEEFRVLKLDRSVAALDACEDPTPYTRPQMRRLLAAIHAGNQPHGGLQLVCEACAIVGVVQLLEGPYLLLVTRRRQLGTICGHKVYGIDATALLPVMSPEAHRAAFGARLASPAEQRYRRLLGGVQLTRDFFFSYTWPVHQTVQRTWEQPPGEGWAEGAWAAKSVWNEYLSRPLREALGHSRFVVPLAHGFFQQRPLALLGRTLLLTLVARRSRHFAGTRYLKRGVSDAGHAANDVEVEQVVEAGLDWRSGQPLLAACVQARGSIPLHWAQRPDSSVVKPEILLHRYDPLYASTRRHFDQLRELYGEPVCVLDLVKRVERRPRESLLGREYAAALRFLNARLGPGQQRVPYAALDLSHRARAARSALLSDLQRLQEPVLAATGVFAAAGGGAPPRLQHGVLRTNCIDSIDRTNVGQFTYGMLALGQQLHALGIAESAVLDPGSSLARHLMDAYEAMGHTLAQQYGGSEAHSAFFQRQRGDWEAATQSRDLLTSVRRFYSNAYADADKQDALNLFLGVFRPQPGSPHIWELGGDTYLHSGFGRNPGRASGLGSRSSSFSGAAGQPGIAAAAADALASFPPPRSPTPPGAAGADALPSPPVEAEAEGEAGGGGRLQESLSNASLVSLSSDGSFAPTLAALVEGAAPQAPPAPQAAAPAPPPPPAAPASPRGAPPAAAAPGSPPSPVPRGPPLLARRSPLLSTGSRGAARLESLDALLSRQPVAHVRLAPPPPAASKGALGWLSPGKPASAAAAAAGGSKAAPAGAAAAAAAVAAAGVAAAGPGVALPLGGLQRSNSDPSMASSLGRSPLQPPREPGGAGPGSPRARRVTFDGAAATVLGPRPGGAAAAAAAGGLLRHRTAPSTTLSELAGELASVALFPGEAGSRPGQQLVVMEPPSDPGSLTFGGLRRPASYHSLAGLNLEGAAAAEEARAKQQRAAPEPAAAKPTRRLSFPGLARLRSFGRRVHPDGGGGGGLARAACETDASQQHPSPSLLGPRAAPGTAGYSAAAAEPLSMSAVVFGAEAVRRGVDTLGVAPAAAWWLTGADPLAAMLEERDRLQAQVERQRAQLAAPLDPVEVRALAEQCAAAMRPPWALSLAAFTQGPRPQAADALAPPVSQPASSAPMQALAF